MAAIVSSFSKLKVLGLADCELPPQWPGASRWPLKVSAFLECCQGLGVDINTFRESWLAHVPRLERLHLNIHDQTSDPPFNERAVFDCAPLFNFLADKCPHLKYLHIHFEEKAFVHYGCIHKYIDFREVVAAVL